MSLFWEVNHWECRVKSVDWIGSELDRTGLYNWKWTWNRLSNRFWQFFLSCMHQPRFTFIIATYFKFASLSVLSVLWFSFWLLWQPDLWVEFNLLNSFGRASPKEHPCQVSSRLAEWFRRRKCLKKLRTTDDARRTFGGHSPPWALVINWAKKGGFTYLPFKIILSIEFFFRAI